MDRETERGRSIAIFRSIHDVIRMEKLFKEAGCWCDLIPVPKAISSDCGMAIQFRHEDEDALLREASTAGVEILRIVRESSSVQGF